MATAEQLLINAIEGDAACQTHLGRTPDTRLYPLQLPQGTDWTADGLVAATFQRISNARENSLDAGGGIDNPRVQVDLYATTRKAAREAAMEVKRVIENGAAFGGWLIDDREELEDDVEPRLYRVSMDFSLWVVET